VNERRLHMGYSFELLTDDSSAAYIRGTVENLEAKMRDGWPCWAISNHDVQRAVTRWGGDGARDADLARQLVALVCSLRGSVCLYQGEELGLTEADVPFEALQDPYGITFWPNFKGRDGCRTPMPWNGERNGGFSATPPWLPVPAEHGELSVSVQDAQSDSVLNGVRHLLRWRKSQPALVAGDIAFLDADEPLLAFTRGSGGETLLVVFNLSGATQVWPVPPTLRVIAPIDDHGLRAGELRNGALHLPPRGVFYARLA
jgi:alpha-glucosidase